MRDTEALGAGDPGALDALWRHATDAGAAIALTEAYRRWGWMAASLDPLGRAVQPVVEELDPARYGLPTDAADPLKRAYCGAIGWEFGHVQDAVRRRWLGEQAELPWSLQTADRRAALSLISDAELFEATLDRRLPGAKTFGLSGAEGFLVLLKAVMTRAGETRVVIGGMHRGRLTQMALVFGKPLAQVIAEAAGAPALPETLGVSADSPYHVGWDGTITLAERDISVWIAPHPSHLSVVAPMAQGVARAERGDALSLSLHTDAAFAGQGVNAEMLQLSGLAPYDVGGTIHLILNNQIGFTTGAEEARSARTAADMAKLIEAPILHVNGDDPDAVLRVAEVACAYRRTFGTDIVVELLAVRRKGHNEIDQPRFTQPSMYQAIDVLPPLSERFASSVGVAPETATLREALDAAFEAARDWRPNGMPPTDGLSGDVEARMLAPVDTGVDLDTLSELARALTELPTHITPHPKVAAFLESRRSMIANGSVDWATAEALALASLLAEGHPVRLSGQDSVRGAFTQRHFNVWCQETALNHCVFDGLKGTLEVFNTPLTENAVLAFEYGHSLRAPGLTIWEAQFGDFLNVAQTVFDQFIACGEDRWLFDSNLVMLLPHGLDGGGPDHATAHPERLLSACARGNLRVVNASTPANYFHALRRQAISGLRKPLVVLAPKALLRHKGCISPLTDLGPTSGFRTVIGAAREGGRRVVLSSGKLAVLLRTAAEAASIKDIALARLEQYYPLDGASLAAFLTHHPDAELVWAQEEPENMGAFQWLDRRLEEIAGRRWRLISRPAAPSAATGVKAWEDAALRRVIQRALDLEE